MPRIHETRYLQERRAAQRICAGCGVYEEAEDIIDDDGELIILSVNEDEDGEIYLEPIEDEKLFNKIGKIFEERLEDLFEFDDEE